VTFGSEEVLRGKFSRWNRLKLMASAEIQYITDAKGDITAVIVPMALWREIESQRETAYLLKSETMKRRLLEAKNRQEGLPLEAVVEKLGI
jgi:PHD/YefM family antitoxin component YafN of YafNO toxin-antitoxin module